MHKVTKFKSLENKRLLVTVVKNANLQVFGEVEDRTHTFLTGINSIIS